MQIVRTALCGRAATMLFSEFLTQDAPESGETRDNGLMEVSRSTSLEANDPSSFAEDDLCQDGYAPTAKDGSPGNDLQDTRD